VFNARGQPEYRDFKQGEQLPDGYSVQPFFPGYKFENGISTYWGEEVGEGGYVYAEPGIWTNVALLDIASMHPSSMVAENLFGPYTEQFHDIMNIRLLVKHKKFDEAKKLFDGKLARYLDDPKQAKALSGALKIAINSVYGLTSAKFENPFRDPRNVDNIVAKRGALFMVNLKHAVQERGYSVAHIKTDSIKIPNASKDIIDFVMAYGKEYGYTFEHEATYEKMCLVNNAVYIAKYLPSDICQKVMGYVPSACADAEQSHPEDNGWTATGAQFAVPYVFKTLFTHQDIEFKDLCETKSVNSSMYLDMGDGSEYKFVGKVGSFCPMKVGYGGTLYRHKTEKQLERKVDKNGNPLSEWASVAGAQGWYWAETEDVVENGLQDKIDDGYFRKQVDEAKSSIAEYGDVERFLSDDPYGPSLKDVY